jgi:hypothetical protein
MLDRVVVSDIGFLVATSRELKIQSPEYNGGHGSNDKADQPPAWRDINDLPAIIESRQRPGGRLVGRYNPERTWGIF